MTVTFSMEVMSGLNRVGHQQMARLLELMEFSFTCSDTLEWKAESLFAGLFIMEFALLLVIMCDHVSMLVECTLS